MPSEVHDGTWNRLGVRPQVWTRIGPAGAGRTPTGRERGVSVLVAADGQPAVAGDEPMVTGVASHTRRCARSLDPILSSVSVPLSWLTNATVRFQKAAEGRPARQPAEGSVAGRVDG